MLQPLLSPAVLLALLRRRSLSDGTPAAAGLPVVAIHDSSHGNYNMGHTGRIIDTNHGNPIVLWDHSGQQRQSGRNKLQAHTDMLLSDGQLAIVGLRVVAVKSSSGGFYAQGHSGTIVRIEIGRDPVVQWDHSSKLQ